MLVSTEWVAARLEDPDVAVVDLRWREDGTGRLEYERSHLPGAAFLDWTTDIVDPEHPVAFMLAGPERFAEAMARCGIGEDTLVVAYSDQLGSGPFRLWWACRTYGHDQVRILDGGLERWLAEGRPLGPAADPPTRRRAPARAWTARIDPRHVATADDVAATAGSAGVAVLDSRPPEQFRGDAVWFETGPVAADADGVARTPRGAVRAGRVPWARNVHAAELYMPDGRMRSPEDLRGLFAAAGVPEAARAITYCGVGISASALLFALHRAGIEGALYDASWEEWGRDPARPVARGPD